MELKSNTKFGKDLTQQYLNGFINLTDYQRMRSNVDDFLEQPLGLWMFVPCGDDGEVLEEPSNYKEWNKKECEWWDNYTECLEYQQAKERCLFDGFEYCESQNKATILGLPLSVSPYTDNGRLYVTKKEADGYHTWFQLFTIEDLIQCNLTLTQTAANQITTTI